MFSKKKRDPTKINLYMKVPTKGGGVQGTTSPPPSLTHRFYLQLKYVKCEYGPVDVMGSSYVLTWTCKSLDWVCILDVCILQLGIAAYFPTHNPCGYKNSAMLLHLQDTALWEDYRHDDNISSASPIDENAGSSPFLPLMQTWIYRICDQPFIGAIHVNILLRDLFASLFTVLSFSCHSIFLRQHLYNFCKKNCILVLQFCSYGNFLHFL